MLYTVGHSTLEKEQFIELLDGVHIDVLIDVRSHQTSRWPQFRKEEMEQWVPCKYEWWPELGGWTKRHLHLVQEMQTHGVDVEVYAKGKFPKQRIADKLTVKDRPSWTSQGLYDYQYFMTLPEFMSGTERLIAIGKDINAAFFCCELLPWKCHRSMIADYLAWRGVDCVHLQPKPKPHSAMLGNRLERYEPEVLAAWGPQVNKNISV